MKKLIEATQQQLDDLWYDGYGEYISNNADPDCYVICNGDTLLEAMEDGYLWEEFLASRGLSLELA
jgi:hypothetical protein